MGKNREFGPDPRNTAWSQDRKRFGYTMLQKMGWQDGEGLGGEGRKGSADPLKVVVRKDNRGIGATTQSANAETRKHTAELNEVLSRLARAATPPPPPKDENEEAAAKAAAESKKNTGIGGSARGRVRNMKNIRAKSGKRTREELSCIFGKDYDVADEAAKSSDSESDSDSSSSSSSSFEEEETRAKMPEKKRAKKTEKSDSDSEEEEDSDVDGDKKAASDEKTVTGLQTTVSKVSSDDYFRQKMLQRKQKLEQMKKQQEEQQKSDEKKEENDSDSDEGEDSSSESDSN